MLKLKKKEWEMILAEENRKQTLLFWAKRAMLLTVLDARKDSLDLEQFFNFLFIHSARAQSKAREFHEEHKFFIWKTFTT